MIDEEYRALFEDLAEYRAPDGTIVQAIWTGAEPGYADTPYWILVPNNLHDPYAEHWQYEVERSGTIAVCYYAGISDDILPLALIREYGLTDLTAADFTKAT